MNDNKAPIVKALNQFFRNCELSFSVIHRASAKEVIGITLNSKGASVFIPVPEDSILNLLSAAIKSVDSEFKPLHDAMDSMIKPARRDNK